MEKSVVIINPSAGNVEYRQLRLEAETFVVRNNLNYNEVYCTKKAGDATLLADEAIKKFGDPTIFCFGGDGTISETINGLGDSDAVLGIIPKGSGNDFIRTFFGKDKKEIIKDIYRCTINGNAELVDIGMLNNSIRVTNGASIGFCAEVARETSFMKHKSYIGAIPKTLLNFKSPKVRITYNDKILEQEITLLAICNGKYYGKGIKIAPNADLQDGKFDICLVDKIPKAVIPFFLPLAMTGTHEGLPFVHTDLTDYIKIESDAPFTYQYDGEPGITDELELAVSKKVKIIRPRKNH